MLAKDDPSAVRCFGKAALESQEPELQNACYERAAFHSNQLGDCVNARYFYAKISLSDPVYDPKIYLEYLLRAAGQLAEGQHKKSAACFKEAAIYYEENKQFLDAARCFEKLLQQRAKYKNPKIKDFEILGRIAQAYKQNGSYAKVLDCCRKGFSQRQSPIHWEKIVDECLDLLDKKPVSDSSEERIEVVDGLIEVIKILRKRSSVELAVKAYELIAKWEQRDLPEIAALFKEAGKWLDFELKHHFFAPVCYKQATERYLRLKQSEDAASVLRDIGFLHQEREEFLEAAKAYRAAAEQSKGSHSDSSISNRAVDCAKAAILYNKAGYQLEAMDSYLSAATLNRELLCYEKAGELFKAAAELRLKGSDHFYEQAAECFLLALRVGEALSCYKKLSNLDLHRLLTSQLFDHVIKNIEYKPGQGEFP